MESKHVVPEILCELALQSCTANSHESIINCTKPNGWLFFQHMTWLCCLLKACPHKGAWSADTLAGNGKGDITGLNSMGKPLVYLEVYPSVMSSLLMPSHVPPNHACLCGQALIQSKFFVCTVVWDAYECGMYCLAFNIGSIH